MTPEPSPLYRRIVVKIGSNVLTRPDGTLDVTQLSHLVDQVAQLHQRGVEVIVVSSGAVASGRSELRGRLIDPNIDEVSARQLFSAVGQAKLINRYYELFREHALACGQVLTTKENFATRRHYLNQRHCMLTMLRQGVVPVVNENDTVSVTELMFTDNDELSGLIATMMDADALIILSNVDGIYTGDPRLPDSRLISRVPLDSDLTAGISTARSSAGRGGMTTKYRIARRVASEGIAVVIANGKRQGILTQVVTDPDALCTRFDAAAERASSVKKWIAHSDIFAQGTVHVNAGAAEALRQSEGVSLLPVGVTAIDGDFADGDIVLVLDPDGATVAWGRATMTASAARTVIGQPAHQPLIHADYIFVP